MRQPSLEQWQDELAAIQSRPAPSPAQIEQNELVHRYRSAGVDLYVNPETQQAIELAVQRTREASGISGPSLQQLQRNESGQYGYDSPIAHYQTGQDGVARQVAVTGSDELRQALGEVRAQQAVLAPIPDSPELRIAALSPDEREAYQQALREANRQGVPTQEAQQVASFAAVSVHAPLQDEALAPQAARDVERQRDAVPAPSIQPQTIQPVAAVAMAAAPATAPPTEAERLQQASPRVQREESRTGSDPRESAKATDEASQRESQRSQQAEASPASTHESEVGQQPVHSAATSTTAIPIADETQTPPRHSAQLQPDHPDHALYQQVRDGVAALDAKHGREFDETSERMSASLLVLAKDSGLDRVDHVLLSQATPESHAGKNLFVVQGEPDNPAHLRASIPTEQAAQTPVGQSLEQFEVVSQKQAQATLERQQEQAQAQLDQVQQQDAQARSMGMR